ncbi:ADP-ribosylglycohydrolase family protein [Chitinophaga rhizophila]|uniref:ADP-ribosylglycohydrolase family protein n=1 Tax=Chitinophaga rhizophila TaxID=2866212 RepID=A0ABS7GBK9_9BACT|nr:ADP-ribosylglycohydrolase family protein [Chitinophaga rhizophila]MBW8684801.1 ADP-ribosylglycohydrolase family protein [Chitinophaga rhizophila]
MPDKNEQVNLSAGERFEAAIIAGAIGDAWGSSYENYTSPIKPNTYYLHPVPKTVHTWMLTDDTQLTLASCEALADSQGFSPEILSNYFVQYYHNRRITGIGASTLKAIQELAIGGHWSQTGRTGDYAAGNGAAMRIAPFAFWKNISREDIRNICRITHKNDEAYTGALAVVLAIRSVLENKWNGSNNLLDLIIPQLPDTNVRDRLVQINEYSQATEIQAVAKLGNNGYVVNSVPFAIFAASRVMDLGLERMFEEIIQAAGDTDTNASIAGQIAGTLLGLQGIPQALFVKLQLLDNYSWLQAIVQKTKATLS